MSRKSLLWRGAVATLLAAAVAFPASAAIPASERQVLIHLYNSTDGDNWTGNSGWKTGSQFSAPGTECSWHGIACDATDGHVVEIYLYNNRLTGTLPDLSSLAALQHFDASANDLSGPLPALPRSIEKFHAFANYLSGTIPSLLGYTSLESFDVGRNNLSGTLPALPDSIEEFWANENDLKGPLADLSGLSALIRFYVDGNNLTGPLPALPDSLEAFGAYENYLSGTIPDLSGLAALRYFDVGNNELTGPLPALPDLIGEFWVDGNNLTGSPTSAPPASLTDAAVCPNYLEQSGDPTIDSGWQTATGKNPWNDRCADPNSAPALWTVTVNVAGGNGSVWPSAPQTGIANGVATSFRVNPDSGFVLDSIIAGACGGSQAGDLWTTDPVTADCTVTVSFKPAASATPIPTLGEWALILMGLLLAGGGAVHLHRQHS